MCPSTTCAEPVEGRCGHLDSSPRIDEPMRHNDPTINSILEADHELNELREAWFASLIDFFSDFENGGTRSSLNSATRNVMNRASTYNMAVAQTSSMLEQALDFFHNGRTCERECCAAGSLELAEPKVYDPLGIMEADILF